MVERLDRAAVLDPDARQAVKYANLHGIGRPMETMTRRGFSQPGHSGTNRPGFAELRWSELSQFGQTMAKAAPGFAPRAMGEGEGEGDRRREDQRGVPR